MKKKQQKKQILDRKTKETAKALFVNIKMRLRDGPFFFLNIKYNRVKILFVVKSFLISFFFFFFSFNFLIFFFL